MFRASSHCELFALMLLFASAAGQYSNSTVTDNSHNHTGYGMASLLIAVPSVVGLTIAACLVKNSISRRGDRGTEENERTYLYGSADSGQAPPDSLSAPLDFTESGDATGVPPSTRTSTTTTAATAAATAAATFGTWFSFPTERPSSVPAEEQKEGESVQKSVASPSPAPVTSSWLPSFLTRKASTTTSRKYYVDILRDDENSIMELTIATPMEDPDIEAAQMKKSSLMPVYREEVQYNLRI